MTPRSKQASPSATVIPQMPMLKWGIESCGAGSLATVLQHYGDTTSMQQWDSTLPKMRGGVMTIDMLLAARGKGFDAQLVTGTPDSIATELQNGRPVILMLQVVDSPGHAYDFFDAWDKEREGYGAYTYVVLRSASDLRTPAVQRRHERLLEIVQHQTDARDVSSSEAPSLNLFCIPVQATRERDRPDLGYGAALANQIKLRMQCGLFTRPELRQRLTGSAGPFLLTVPVRIGATDATTPLLLADLTTYPEAAIRDLATAYMGTLLRDFPRRQTLWKPPVAQKVALSLIWFASETSGLLQTVIPAGQATPGG